MPFTGRTSRYFVPLAMLIAGLAAGSDAFGSCGDYLYSAHRGEMKPESSNRDSQRHTTQETAATPSPIHAPCNGHGCRNAPTTPSETAPLATPHRIDNNPAVTSATDAHPPRPDAHRQMNLDAGECPAGHSRRIDRPPQTRA